jgi:uncharacterized protein (TIGR00297 family)
MLALETAPWVESSWVIALGVNTVIAGLGLLSSQKALTRAGVFHAWILGILVWGGLGWRGYSIVSVYFLIGTLVTRAGKAQKEAKGIAEKRGGARGPENVWGSALTGAICALGQALAPHPLWWLAYASSFAAKLGDTTSSEIGKAYGQKTFLITTLRPVPAGTEGAISLEGTLAGILAAGLLSGLANAFNTQGAWILNRGNQLEWFGICWLAAVIANFMESWIGVVLQPRFRWLTNEVVNGIQTSLAALLAVAAASLLL